jgi:hypothetical protein
MDYPSGLRYALAVILASSPAILWVAPSLMLDVLVCIAVVTLAVLCLEGQDAGSVRSWVAIGICAGMTWAAKYSRKAFVGHRLGEIEPLFALGNRWPRTWFTGWEPVGHMQVQPMEATVWELSLHALDPRSEIQYLSSPGCDYWLVQKKDVGAVRYASARRSSTAKILRRAGAAASMTQSSFWL